jgi:FixJ family two-component response regulator
MAERRVLIGSHDQAVVALFDELGEEIGYESEVTESASDLLLQLLDKDYAMAILDLDLPCGGGAKMVAVIRRVRPKVPVVVLSSDPSVEVGSQVVQEGVAYYCLKPVAKEPLKEVVTSLLAAP